MLMNNLRNFPPVTLGIFQSTLLQEERRPYVMIYDKYKLFQSTLLQEERRDAGYRFRKPYGNFNPRSYKRSDTDLRLWLFYYLISIHAPTRGATSTRMIVTPAAVISIHAPTRGATKSHTMYPINAVNFNPRSYKRSDVPFLP